MTLTPIPPTNTATPTPLSPLLIEAMRQQVYPGSELVIESVLEGRPRYDRYIASYRSDGYKIFALLTIPKGEPPASGWPVILFNHGYVPPDRYRTTRQYVDYIDYLAARGYIVFMSDYRGHGSSEGLPSSGYGTVDYTVDVLNGLASIQRLPQADPDRIGMWGHSMGGFVTLRAMVVSEEIKAGVIWSGAVASFPDLLTRWQRNSAGTPIPILTATPSQTDVCCTPAEQTAIGSFLAAYGDWEENPAFWAGISPITFVDDLSGPLQLHHARRDTVVPAEFSESLYAALGPTGGPHELYLYEGDNHNMSVNFLTAMSLSVNYLDRYLKFE